MRFITWRAWPCNAMLTSPAHMRRCGRRGSVMVKPYAVLAIDCCVSSWPCCVIGRTMMRAGCIVSRSCRWGKKFDKLGLTNGRKSLPQLPYAQVVKTVRRRRLVDVQHRVVFGSLEAVNHVLAPLGWHINTAFVERLNLSIRQHVAAVGRRVSTLCKGEDGLRQQVALYHVYYNFCLPHASVRQPVPQPVPTNGTGSATQWRPCTPAMAAGLTDHVRTVRTMPSQCLSIDNSNDRAERGVSPVMPDHPEPGSGQPQGGVRRAGCHCGYVCRANCDAPPVPGPSHTPSIAPRAWLGS